MPETELTSSTSLVLLDPLLAALGGRQHAFARPYGGLPAPVFQFHDLPVLLCATALMQDHVFEPQLLDAARELDLDTIMVRHGLAPETLDAVSYDVVLSRPGGLHRLWSRYLYRHVDGGLWLVPPQPGLIGEGFVELTPAGLRWTGDAPYADGDEYSDGVSRAARATVLSLRAR